MWQKSEWIWKEKGTIVRFALNVPLHGRDLLDNRIGSLLTNFQLLSVKKVLIFPQIVSTSTLTLKMEVEVDKFFEKIRTFFTESR